MKNVLVDLIHKSIIFTYWGFKRNDVNKRYRARTLLRPRLTQIIYNNKQKN